MEWKNKIGVYAIINKKDNKIYIGSASQSFIIRFNRHLNDLKNNKHHSLPLQRAYNKYGAKKFKFKVIQIVDLEDAKVFLHEIETAWIRYYDSANPVKGYNLCKIAGGKIYGNIDKNTALKIKKLSIRGYGNKKIASILEIPFSYVGKVRNNKLYNLGFYIDWIKERRKYIKLKEKNKKLKLMYRIKCKLEEGITPKEICKQFKISLFFISQIKLGNHKFSNIIGVPNIQYKQNKPLTELDKIEIKKMLLEGIRTSSIAKKYNKSHTAIYKLKKEIM